jgi:16S rRNA processing protein RimM
VAKTQGRRGEVAVEVHSDVLGRLHQGMRVFALTRTLGPNQDARRELRIDDAWPHKSYVVLKLAGVDSISDAEPLVGSELQVPRSERAALEAGAAYVSDLIGCTVLNCPRGDLGREDRQREDRGLEIGVVKDVRFGAGEAPLLVVAGKAEYDIPYAQEFLVQVDLEHKRIEMVLPDGLLDVNAPLTDEEKQEQKQKR